MINFMLIWIELIEMSGIKKRKSDSVSSKPKDEKDLKNVKMIQKDQTTADGKEKEGEIQVDKSFAVLYIVNEINGDGIRSVF